MINKKPWNTKDSRKMNNVRVVNTNKRDGCNNWDISQYLIILLMQCQRDCMSRYYDTRDHVIMRSFFMQEKWIFKLFWRNRTISIIMFITSYPAKPPGCPVEEDGLVIVGTPDEDGGSPVPCKYRYSTYKYIHTYVWKDYFYYHYYRVFSCIRTCNKN